MIVGALCIRDEKILMAKRNIHPRKGLWTLPAGFMENAETLQAGALRETMEETGSEAKVIMPYTMFSLPHINQVHLFYLADLLHTHVHARMHHACMVQARMHAMRGGARMSTCACM